MSQIEEHNDSRAGQYVSHERHNVPPIATQNPDFLAGRNDPSAGIQNPDIFAGSHGPSAGTEEHHASNSRAPTKEHNLFRTGEEDQ